MTGVGREEPVVERAERVRKPGEKAKESGCVEDGETEDNNRGRRRLCGKGAGWRHGLWRGALQALSCGAVSEVRLRF